MKCMNSLIIMQGSRLAYLKFHERFSSGFSNLVRLAKSSFIGIKKSYSCCNNCEITTEGLTRTFVLQKGVEEQDYNYLIL